MRPKYDPKFEDEYIAAEERVALAGAALAHATVNARLISDPEVEPLLEELKEAEIALEALKPRYEAYKEDIRRGLA